MGIVKRLLLIYIKISILMSVFILTYVVFFLNNKIDSYSIKNDKYDGDIEISYSMFEDEFVSKNEINSVQNFISCYENSMDYEEFPDALKNKVNEIDKLFKENSNNVSFTYEDLYTGLHISYNEDQLFFGASTVKAPVILYLYEQADLGKIDLNEQLVYIENYFVEGSGNLQNEPFGSQYTIYELSKKSIVESDNIAYQMISYNLNSENIKNFWIEKGASSFWNNSIWNDSNSKDGAIYMKELYKYYITKTENSEKLMDFFYSSVMPLISSNKDIRVAHKSGWRGSIVHDTALVLDEYPYVLTVFTDLGYTDYKNFFTKTSNLVEEIHDIYWKTKSNYCFQKTF